MARVATISITPTTRTFTTPMGSSGAIITSGSGTWTAAVSDPWITLAATSGSAGTACGYQVSVNTNVEQRVGYVYVSGYTHTITQAGQGGSIGSTNAEFEKDGGTGTVTVNAADKMVWHARPNVDWLSVMPTVGVGNGKVTFQVAPWYEVTTRSGTLTIAGQTFTVFQYGKRIELDPDSTSCDYQAHVVPITVDALAIQSWSVVPQNSWLSVVDAGSGKGAGMASIAVAENPSYKARTGTVKIGTEVFAVNQAGRTALSFTVSPTSTTASLNGANGLLEVAATPDLPWTASTTANWLTLYNTTGSGNGNVVFVASPNSTLYQRTATIAVTPEKASGVAAKGVTVKQPAQSSSVSSTGYEFAAAGESTSVDVTVANIVEWKVENVPSWITITSGTSYTGPGTVTILASPNDTVYPRSATIKIANKTFAVSQLGRGVKLSYDTIVFDTDGQPKNGGIASFSIEPDGNVAWTAVASDPTWIILFGATSGTGKGEIEYVIAPYSGNGEPRTGTITVGDKKVYITQRAYDLSITPSGTNVVGNAGAGEIGVSASINDIWTAIVTEPWITVVSGYDAGKGSGTVRFTYTENNTGKTRTGKIVVSGEAYTLVQAARVTVNIKAESSRGGSVSGAGAYTQGEKATLTAVPSDGYRFAYWEGAVSTMQNPVEITADASKSVRAVFSALTPDFAGVACDTEGVSLVWRSLAWASEYRIYRAPTGEKGTVPLVTLTAAGTSSYKDTTGDVGKTYWYWVEAVGDEDTTECASPVAGAKEKPVVWSAISYTNLRGATHSNTNAYREGASVSFSTPQGGPVGYTFTGWSPATISADMTGDQTIAANWTANSYTIAYHANGGSGTIPPTLMTYDVEGHVAANGFTYAGHVFTGWATSAGGEVVYGEGDVVSNLTSDVGGVVELWAVWETTGGGGDDPVVYIPPSWVGVTKSDTMTVYATVKDRKSGARIATVGSLLAAFDKNGECRGSAEVEEGPFSAFFQLSVGIESTSETGFVLKVWNAATGETTEIGTTFDANSGKVLGAFDELIVYEIGLFSQKIALNEGWTWLSFSLTPDDSTVGSLFSGCVFANGDMLKASNKTVTYYNGVWYPATYALAPGTTYMVRKSSGGAEEVEVTGAEVSDGLVLSAGWNWIGPTTLTTQTVSSISHTGGLVNGDLLKSSSKTATWYGGRWYPADFKLCPGCGYVAKFANAGTLCCDERLTLSEAPVLTKCSALKSAFAMAGTGKPAWKEVTKGDNMTVYATIHDLSEDLDLMSAGSLLAAFDSNGECRGVAEVEPGPLGQIFQLTVGIESTGEKGFVLKFWDAAGGAVYEVVERIDANVDKQIGQIFEPVVYTVETSPSPPVQSWKITYVGLHGTTHANPNSYAAGEEITFAAPTTGRTGYAFAGWTPTGISASTTGDTIVSATWTPITYSITYADTKGQPNGNPLVYTIEDELTFSALSDVANFAFAEWAPSNIVQGSTGNKLVTAIWEWTPSNATVGAAVTGGKTLDIQADWAKFELVRCFGEGKDRIFREKFGADFATALTKKTGKRDGAGHDLCVWHDYVAGTDPTDSNSVFQASLQIVDGRPVVDWKPNLNSNGEARVYTVYGKADLSESWHSPTNSADRFFKVGVAMPGDGPIAHNTISLDLGGGVCDSDPIVVKPGDPIGSLPTPEREGYLFVGWYTSEQGGTEVVAETIAGADMTIFARWKKLGEDLVHRWSFNGSLNDSVGSQTAVAVGSVAVGQKQYTLAGGTRGTSYIDLGDNIMPLGTEGATIELWATRLGAQGFSRVIDIGSSYMNYLFWGWQAGNSVETDSCGVYALVNTNDEHSGVPFTQDKEYHLSILIKPVSTHWEVSYIKRDPVTLSILSSVTISSEGRSWTPTSLGQTNCWLGHSQWGDNYDASASYNEVRIWNRALTDDELAKSAKAGPDMLAL